MKSAPQEIQQAQRLVQQTEVEIIQLVAEGRQVHIIWDFDRVLSSSLSDDVFRLRENNLENYFDYEARLFLSSPRPGLWLPLAQKVGELHTSQDIVTARSSFLSFRVMTFCMWHCGLDISRWVRWILFLGHQSKADSFRIILESLKKDPRFFFVLVDDNFRHVEIFNRVCQTMKMADRTRGIVSPQIRDYTEEQLRLHYESIMTAEGDQPTIVPGFPGGYSNGFIVFPNGLEGFRNLVRENFLRAEQESVIEKFAPWLELTARDLFPEGPITPERLHCAFRFLQKEAIHDTMVLNEIMEGGVRSGQLTKED